MADKSISQLGVATTLTGDELTVVVQNGVTKQTQLQDIANLGGPAGPVGPQGPTGPTGPGATIQVNSTVTGAPGTNASVTNVGSLQTAMFNFVIPRGDVGATGATGATGPQGPGVAAGGTAGQVLIKASSVDYATAWLTLTGTGTVTSVNASGGTTGLTFSGGPITAAGVLTLGGILDVANGGTGTTTLTGYLKGNGIAPFSAVASIPTSDLSGTISNLQLANSAITINGNSVSLGGSTTVTATATNALTIGTGLSGTSYNGSTAVTIAIDSTVATLTGSQTLTNKTISGANNTLSNIGNSSLTNSSLTVGTTNIALGATSLTLGGLTSVTVTQDPVAALDLATKQYVDTVAQGLNAKAACVYSTTANITLSGLGTQAGGDWASSLTVGDRILVKNQSSSQFNGIYVAAAGTWARSADMNVWAEVPSSFVFISNGATLADTGWVTTADAGGTIDVTAMPWVQFSGAGTYTAGTGLTLAGSQFSITNIGTAGTYGSSTLIPVITTNAQGQVTNVTTASNPQGTVTSVTGTAPISVATGTTTPVVSLDASYGDTQNPYASKTANYVLAAPNGSAGVPSFRALVSTDLPSLSSVYIPYTGASSAINLNAQTVVNIDHLGIGTTTVPTILIRAVGDNNSNSRIAMRGYSSNANSSSIRVTKFRGTAAAPQAPQSGDSLGKFELAGYGTTSSDGYPQASFEGLATEAWGATARGTKTVIKVTPNTTTTQVIAVTIDQNSAATFANTVTAINGIFGGTF